MTGFRCVMVPVDFTANNQPALKLALRLAQPGHTKVILVHVVEKISGSFPTLKSFHHALLERARRQIQKYELPFRRRTIQVVSLVVLGKRAPTIVRLGIQHRVDLMVISSHRIDLNHPSSDWASVSYRVAVLSQSPVLLVK